MVFRLCTLFIIWSLIFALSLQIFSANSSQQTQQSTTATTTPQAQTTTTAQHAGYTGVSQDYSQGYYDPSYWQNYSAWQGYYDQTGADPNAMAAYADPSMQDPSAMAGTALEPQTPVEDELELIGMKIVTRGT